MDRAIHATTLSRLKDEFDFDALSATALARLKAEIDFDVLNENAKRALIAAAISSTWHDVKFLASPTDRDEKVEEDQPSSPSEDQN